MKNIIIIILVLGLIGGGVYWFKNKSSNTSQQINTEAINNDNNDEDDHSEVGVSVNVPVTPINVPIVTTDGGVTTKTFTVSGSNFSFDLKTIEVNKGDRVKIVFKNTVGKHDWRIDEFNASTKVIGAGEEETIQFLANKSGSFEYYCSVGSHRAMGMKGTLVVK